MAEEFVLWELPGVARIAATFSGGKKFERMENGHWRPCGAWQPLQGMTKGQARACRKAMRREGFSAHLRRSL